MTQALKGSAIDCYTAATPNGRRVLIMLEETGLPYFPIWIDLMRGEQRSTHFLAINPEGAIPAIIDHRLSAPNQQLMLSQSAAILIYLAETSGHFLPQGAGRYNVLQWLMLCISDVACASSSAFQVSRIKGDIGTVSTHFATRIARYLAIAERQLQGRDFLAGAYSIADMCLYANTLVPSITELIRQSDNFPNLRRWEMRMAERPAVARAIVLCPPSGSPSTIPG
jgi:GSH-dependent disulfide-bond oxidoreductase